MNALTVANVETEIDNLAPRIAALLPPDVSPDKFRAVALAAIRAKPDLMQKCDQQSLFNAILNAAQDGLMPDGREGAIVPRKGKAVWQPMTLGILKRVKSSGSVATLAANVVYDGETFEVLLGDEDRIVHRRDMARVQRGQEVAVYAIATLKDGSKEREVMTWDQVQDVRQSSAAPDSEPWTKWADEMGRKTVIRRLAKRLPVIDPADEALQRTIGRVDSLYDFGAAPADRPVVEHTEPDARDAMNATAPLKAAAADMPKGPKVTEKASTKIPSRKAFTPIPRSDKEWETWMDDFQLACVSMPTRADLAEYIGRPAVSDVIAAAPAGVRRDIDRQIAVSHGELAEEPEPEAGKLPEVEIVGADKLAG